MFDFSRYDFGYSWLVVWGHVVPLALAVVGGAVAVWRRWPRWLVAVAVVVVLWAVAGLLFSRLVTRPQPLPTARFLATGSGRVLDVGAGSGRAAVGVLLARPQARVTGLDIYSGYFGIDDNTPERFLRNARAADAADRAETRTGDMREMPFADGEFDAVISSYAIDHLRRNGIVKTVGEVARVLKPRGEFLLMIVNPDLVVRILSPHAMAHHPRPDPAWWRGTLEKGGFVVEEEGTSVGTLYYLARKPR